MTINCENYDHIFRTEIRATPNNSRDSEKTNVPLPMLITGYATNLL